MNLLAIETSSSVGSVALQCGAGIEQREIAHPREQTARVLPLVDELLQVYGIGLERLDGIVFGRGPGSFTGLRVAASVAQGLATAVNLPVLAVSSLQAIAQHAHRIDGATRVLVCVDARMGEVYSGLFELRDDVMQPLSEEQIGDPENLSAAGPDEWILAGSGVSAHPESLRGLAAAATRVLPDIAPAAVDLLPQALIDLEAGRALAPEAALPVYLRGESAWRSNA